MTKYVLIINGGCYDYTWERPVGIYNTKEDAEKAEEEMRKIINEKDNRNPYDDASNCRYCAVEENPDLKGIDLSC